MVTERFLPGVPGREIEGAYNAAPGNEIQNGKFDSPESSARLAANTFGFFLSRLQELPPLPGCEDETWPATSLALEREVRLPWRSGRHPVLDALVATPSALIGIECKRFEPFRTNRVAPLSDAYWRPKWGDHMQSYERVRDRVRSEAGERYRLDAAQLFKHALALRTQVHRPEEHLGSGLRPILLYVYAEPEAWPNTGEPVDHRAIADHREEIEAFAEDVSQDEVRFVGLSYRKLLAEWRKSASPDVRKHAEAVLYWFAP
ncbi:MAG: hypothetical protein OXI25_01565 [Chloroflexota bacterium]|nr:hypothetical protein [Chloroflexota bacterium]